MLPFTNASFWNIMNKKRLLFPGAALHIFNFGKVDIQHFQI